MLFDGEGTVNFRSEHFDVESAKLWDLPDERVPIGVAVSGADSCRLAGSKADLMIATEPKAELGWKVNADLPNPDSFAGATQFVTEEQVADQLACGPDVEEHLEKIKPFIAAGFTEIALVQIGAESQAEFTAWAESELLPALRSL